MIATARLRSFHLSFGSNRLSSTKEYTEGMDVETPWLCLRNCTLKPICRCQLSGEAKARLEKYGNPVTVLSYFVVRCFGVSFLYMRVIFERSVEMQSYGFDMPEAKKID